MRVLIACECSGIVRDAFNARGHSAFSCDLAPSERPGPHILADCLTVLDQDWDLLIAHPPCRYLSASGLHWTTRGLRDPKLTLDAIKFAETLWQAPIPHVCIENPIGALSTRSILGRHTQTIQPYQFGHDASKRTALWLKNLHALTPTNQIAPRLIAGRPRWANQTDSGQNKLAPSPQRAANRARTYPGIAAAMANQWGNL